MVALTIPYIVPLFLGMTLDARSYSPGVTIFDDAAIANAENVTIGSITSSYAVVTQYSQIRDALEVYGDLAFKIKMGNMNVKGSGSYIKNQEGLQNSVIILSTFKYISRVTSLGSALPMDTWLTDFSKGVLGTHYVDSVVYGVEMVASLKFTASDSFGREEIQAELDKLSIDSKGKANELTASGKLDKLVERVKDKSQLEISYFGTLPLRSVNNTVAGFKDLVANFSHYINEAGLEDGLPQTVNLKELTSLPGGKDVKEFQYTINSGTSSRFETFQDAYLRLSEARDKLFSWSRTLPFDLSDESSQKIGKMIKELNDDMNLCYALASKVDLTSDPSILDGDQVVVGKSYMLRVKLLMKDIETEVMKNVQVTTDTYIHWGNNNCPGSEVAKLYDGYTVGSTIEGVGGMAKYDCMSVGSTEDAYALNDTGYQSLITGINYGKISRTSNPFNGDFARYVSESVVPCAKCHQLDASTVSVFPADADCPASWDLKYTGYLMSGATDDAHTTQYICVDDTPSDPRLLQVTDKENSMALTVVHTGGSLPDTYVNGRLVPCAVCAFKGGLIL